MTSFNNHTRNTFSSRKKSSDTRHLNLLSLSKSKDLRKLSPTLSSTRKRDDRWKF